MKKLISIAALVLIGMTTAFADVNGKVVVDDILYYANSDGTATAMAYDSRKQATDVVVEENITYDGVTYPVTKLGTSIFEQQTTLQSVHLPACIQEIGDRAFYNCTSLSSVEIPDNTTLIGKAAFYNCQSLTTISFSGEDKTIGKEAFRSCSGLTTVSQSAYLSEVGDYAFYECKNLEWNDFTRVGLIGDYAFSRCNISGIIKFGDTDLNEGSFSENTGIRRVIMCTSRYYYYRYWDAPFSSCDIELIVIPKSSSQFPSHFFTGINSKAVVVSSESLDTSSLLNVVTNCEFNPDEIDISDDLVIYDSPAKTKLWYAPVVLPEIPSTVKEIATGALRRYPGKNLIIPENVVKIGGGALYSNSSLQSITFPDHFLFLPDGLLYNCTSLEHVDLPSNLRTLSSSMFKYCESLQEIQLPDTLINIYEQAFYGSGIKKITIPKTVRQIRDDAFQYSQLESIDFADGCELRWFGSDVFSYSKLTSMRLLKTITNMGYSIFPSTMQEVYIEDGFTAFIYSLFRDESNKHLNLKKIIYNSMDPLELSKDMYSRLFSEEMYETCTLEVPVGSFARFVIPWKYFKNIVENPDLAGVDDVTIDLPADDAPVEYYDMQGRRVEHPSSGLYIRRQGPKAEKVIFP